MSASYSGDPTSSPIDEVRFLLADTDMSSPLLQDEEISYLLAKLDGVYSDNYMVAAFAAESVAAKYAGEVAISADGVTYSGDQLQQKYQALAVQLREQYTRLREQGVEPYAGGTDELDVPEFGVRPLNFGIGMDDNNRAGSQRYGNYQDYITHKDAGDPGSWMW